MSLTQLQARLTAAGHVCAGEGTLGPVTYAAALGFAAQRPLGPAGQAFGLAMATHFSPSGIDTDLRRIHWIAQACHETAGFRQLTELGDAAYFRRYEGREDLGNDRPGDGYEYRGRGLFQITGRWNYRRYSAILDEPLEDNPGLAAQPGMAVRIACAFWAANRINPAADADDCAAVTAKINGGLTGLAERQAITDRLKTAWGI